MTGKYELLLPAGEMDSLIAAVKAGADAVYLGGAEFSARKKAKNFSRDELTKAVSYCHLRDVKVYVAINTLLCDEEVLAAFSYVEFLYEIGVDALIIQDLGLAEMIHQNLPDFDLHASTQMAINSYSGAEVLQEIGFSRVVLARECPLSEIEKISKLKIEIEAFIHGALCISYSGQCLMSSMIGGRSGNRGECAQACRKTYDILDDKKNAISKRAYYLSPRDLGTFEEVFDLIEAGVYSLKIEGRMKRPQYVYQACKTYKDILEGRDFSKDKEELTQLFNRDFTKGLAKGDKGKDFMAYERPSHKGVGAGRVKKKTPKGYLIEFMIDIKKGDDLEFLDDKDRTFRILAPFEAKKFSTYEFSTTRNIKIDSEVRRLTSSELIDKINTEIEKKKDKRPLEIKASFLKGKKASLEFKSGTYKAFIESDEVLQGALKAPVKREKIIENLSKVGESEFYLEKVDLVSDDIFIAISRLNDLRRRGLQALEEKIVKRRKIPKKFESKKFAKVEKLTPGLCLEVSKTQYLKNVDLDKLKRVYLKNDAISQESLEYLKNFDGDIFAVLNNIYYSKEEDEILKKLKDLGFKNVEINNLGQVEKFKDFNLHIGSDMNIFNSYAANFMFSNFSNSISLSEEMDGQGIATIDKKISGNLERTVYGHLKIMTMEHNPLDLLEIETNSKTYFLRDGLGAQFPFLKADRTEIYTDKPIFLLDILNEVRSFGINLFRIRVHFKNENAAQLVDMAYEAIKGNTKLFYDKDLYDRGHIYKGII